MTRITTLQNDYLKAIEAGNHTTKDLQQHFTTRQSNVSRILRVLRDAGLVSFAHNPGTRATKIFTLTAPYADLDLEIIHRSIHKASDPISDIEVHYVAKLRNAGLIGQRLIEAHQRKYPDRPAKSIQLLVAKAKAKRLCR